MKAEADSKTASRPGGGGGAAAVSHTIKCHLCINSEYSSNSHLCATCVNIYLDNLQTRFEVEKKSAQKLRGAFKARLKTFLQVSKQVKETNQAKPSLEQLREKVAFKRAQLAAKRETKQKRGQLIEEFQVQIGQSLSKIEQKSVEMREAYQGIEIWDERDSDRFQRSQM